MKIVQLGFCAAILLHGMTMAPATQAQAVIPPSVWPMDCRTRVSRELEARSGRIGICFSNQRVSVFQVVSISSANISVAKKAVTATGSALVEQGLVKSSSEETLVISLPGDLSFVTREISVTENPDFAQLEVFAEKFRSQK